MGSRDRTGNRKDVEVLDFLGIIHKHIMAPSPSRHPQEQSVATESADIDIHKVRHTFRLAGNSFRSSAGSQYSQDGQNA